MSVNDKRGRRSSFDRVAELYDRYRPGYPNGIFDDLRDFTGQGKGYAILEVGCGTGQATRFLLERGWRVTAVELGANLARLARRNLKRYGGVQVVQSSFEEFDPKGSRFDMVFAATSWHWVDPRVGYAKAAGLLRPGGFLAILTSDQAFPADQDPFFARLRDFQRSLGLKVSEPLVADKILDEDRLVRRSGFFGKPMAFRYQWSRKFSAVHYLGLLQSHSTFQALGPDVRQKILTEAVRLIRLRSHRTVTFHTWAVLHLAPVLSSGG